MEFTGCTEIRLSNFYLAHKAFGMLLSCPRGVGKAVCSRGSSKAGVNLVKAIPNGGIFKRYIRPDSHRAQLISSECLPPDTRNAWRDINAGQPVVHEREILNACNTAGDVYAGQPVFGKGTVPDSGNAIRKRNAGQLVGHKRGISDIRNTVGDGHLSQPVLPESAKTNVLNAVGDSNISQLISPEHKLPDAPYV